MKWLLVHGPDVLYPESPWAISHMRTGSILVDARIYSIAELRQVWLTHRDEILADHPAAWAVTALRDADET